MATFYGLNDLPAHQQPEDASTASVQNAGITAEQLIAAERADKYKRQLERPEVFPSQENWEYIIDARMDIIAPELYRKYLIAWLTPEKQRSDFHYAALSNFGKYITAIDRQAALDAIYEDVTSSPEATLDLIAECRMFDAEHLMQLLDEGIDPAFVAECMDAYQPMYRPEDLTDMQHLLEAMNDLPDQGSVSESRSFFGSGIRYICPNGHSNNRETRFCTQCGEDIHGLTERQSNIIAAFERRLATLRRILAKSKI